jgi:hypothetical protein
MFNIIAVNPATKTFTVTGDHTTVFTSGVVFQVQSSTSNDGIYTTVSSTLNATDTDIVVVEIIPTATADGTITTDVYTLERSDPTAPTIIVPVNEINTDLDINFVGKSKFDYGEPLQIGLLHLLENFASPVAPTDPISGQLWYRKDNDTLFVRNAANDSWNTISGDPTWILYDGVALTSPHTASAGEYYLVDTSSTALTLVLPATPSFGDTVVVAPALPTFNTNNLTVQGNGTNIGAQTSDVTFNENIAVRFVYVNATIGWAVVELGDQLAVTNTDGIAFFIELEDTGIGHKHVVFVTDDQAAQLISGQVPSLVLTSTVSNSHVHEVTLEYLATGQFVVTTISNNHVGQEHTARLFGWNNNETFIFLDSAVDVSPYAAQGGDQILVDTSTAAFSITLPASPSVNDKVTIAPSRNTFIANNVTVLRNGNNISGQSQDLLINDNKGYDLIFANATIGWVVLERGGSLFLQQLDDSGIGTFIDLIDNGIGHSHRIFLTDAELTSLVDGSVATLNKTSDTVAGHSHTVDVTYSNGRFIPTITNNHAGTSNHYAYVHGQDSRGTWTRFDGTTLASPYTAQRNEQILVNTTTSALTVVLPTNAQFGDSILLAPVSSLSANNLIIDNNGQNINSVNDTVTVNVTVTLEVIYYGSTIGWAVVQKGDTSVYAPVVTIDNWIDINSATTLTPGLSYFTDTSGSAFTVTLPIAPSNGNFVVIHDVADQFNTNNLTVNGNGQNIMGSATLVLNGNGDTAKLVYSSTQSEWRRVN